MKKVVAAIVLFGLLQNAIAQTTAQSVNRDKRMEWWREARFGMFIHWGVYSVPAGY